MKLFRWYYGPLLVLGAWWLPTIEANAETDVETNAVSVACRAGMNTAAGSTGNVNIGSKITPANAHNASLTVTLIYSCTNLGSTAGTVSVCLGADGGSYSPTNISPRYMSINGPGTNPRLAFTMTQNNTLWGTRNGSGSEYNSGAHPIAAGSTITGQTSIKFSLVSAPSNINATPGVYTSSFLEKGNTTLRYEDGDLTNPNADCTKGIQAVFRFPFTVEATVIPSCEITAKPTDINLKNIAASATNTKGSTSIGVTCTNGAAYNIGLAPSNGNVNGAGIMTGTIPNSDVIPYQLQSTDGTAWGNTLPAESIKNGVADKGTGVNQSHIVHVVVPSADFKPDDYSDIVNISVNY